MRTLIFAALTLLAVACSTEAETDADPPLQAGQCREPADCDAGQACASSDTINLCGPAGCGDTQCNADFDCKLAMLGDVCVTIAGVRVCRPACGDESPCTDDETCASDGHCEPKACTDDGGCSVNFGCLPNICRRRFCDRDSDCEGHCVNGECFEVPGLCQ